MTRDYVVLRTAQVAFLCFLLGIFAALLFISSVFAVPSIALATDKPLYERGEGIFFFGRGYGYPNLTLIFWLVIDQNLGGGYVRNWCVCPLQAYPPEWSFAIGWKSSAVGNFSAYMIGPNHTLSPTLKFRIIEPIPVPELDSRIGIVFAFVAATLIFVPARLRNHRRR